MKQYQKYFRILVISLLALTVLQQNLTAQDFFRSESWDFDRSVRGARENLYRGNLAQRYRAALTLFMGSVGKNTVDTLEAAKAMEDIFDNIRRNNPSFRNDLLTFTAMAGYFYLGAAETAIDPRERERFAQTGLRYLDDAYSEAPRNLDVLYIYVRSTWFIPTTYEDRTPEIKEAGERFLRDYDRLRNPPVRMATQREAVLIALATVAIEENDLVTAKKYFDQINSRNLRSLETLGCERMIEAYKDVERALLPPKPGKRVRNNW